MADSNKSANVEKKKTPSKKRFDEDRAKPSKKVKEKVAKVPKSKPIKKAAKEPAELKDDSIRFRLKRDQCW